MGVIARMVKYFAEKFATITGEPRKGLNHETLLYTPAGDDSIPLPDERLLLVKIDGAGKYVTAAVLTPSQGAKPGEKIFFARDKGGSIVSKLSFFNNGNVKLDTDTETAGEASGDYTRITKGRTSVTEKGDRARLSERNATENVRGNYAITVDGDYTLNVRGRVVINGRTISLN